MVKLDTFETKEEAIAYIQENVPGCAKRETAERYLRDRIPKEAYYQRKIIEFIKKKYPTAFIWKAAAGAYSQQGIPDVCAVIGGRYFGFEVKRPFFGTASKIQIQTIDRIREAGGIAAVVCFPQEVQRIVEKSLA